MKREAILDYFIFNSRPYTTAQMEIFDSLTSLSIYEVIRLIDVVPLYLEEHLKRMRDSAELLGYEIQKTDEDITAEIIWLAQLNQCNNINVKLLCNDLDQKEQSYITYFIESQYPQNEVYEKGIATILFYSERTTPNAKTVNTDLREGVNAAIKSAGAYEGLLVNKDGYVTEGSRSNVFFVKGEKIYTAPAKEVLMGVTRMRIMEACSRLNIPVVEEDVHEDSLGEIDAAFISGTSVNVLPIASIESISFDSMNNAIIKKISACYLEDMKEYLEKNNSR